MINADNSIKVDGLEKSIIDKCKQRIIAVAVIFFVSFIVVNIKLIHTSKPLKAKESASINIKKNVKRGNILDRNGNILAVSLPTWTLFKNSSEIYDLQFTHNQISQIIPQLDKIKLKEHLESKKKYQVIARQLTPKMAKKINKLGQPSLNFNKEYLRVYPYHEEISHIIGYLGKGNNGLAGVERKYNNILNKGENLYLTIDSRVQYKVFKTLKNGINLYKYKGAVGIVLDVTSGEVISAVSFPSYNPNAYSSFQPTKNQITNSVFAMGSIFKSLTIAAALNENIVNEDSKFDVTQPIELPGKTIVDYHGEDRILGLREVFTYSSNIGTTQIALNLGIDKQQYYFKQLGFKKRLDTGVAESEKPVMIPESKIKILDLALMSYGHSIDITPLHAISALAATINGGEFIEPMVVQDNEYSNRVRTKIFSKKVTNIMKDFYRNVVEEGTASKIKMDEYKIGGKTGTSNKFINGKQSQKKVISSFISFFPIDKPKYAVFILLDEPKSGGKILGRTAGFNAVPLSKEIIMQIAPILGVKRINKIEL